MVRWLVGLAVLALVVAGSMFVLSGRETPPTLHIEQPGRVIGQTGTRAVSAEAPGTRFGTLSTALAQNGRRIPLFSLGSPDAARTVTITPAGPDRLTITRPLGKQSVPELQSGTARIV